MNASLEFNLKTLRPTYHLILGIPGKSNALVIAERLGMPAEIIIRARAALNPEDIKTDNMLDEIIRQRDASKKVRSSADRIRTEAEKLQQELQIRLEGIEVERRQILNSARKQAEKDLEELLTEIDSTRQELAKAHQPLKQIVDIRKSAETIHTLVRTPVDKKAHATDLTVTPVAMPYKIGDKVFITSLQTRAVVTDVGVEDVEVQFGSLRARTQLADIQKEDSGERGKPSEPAKTKSSRTRTAARPTVFRESPGLELNIRGQRVDDATSLVERYLEHAYMAGLPFARIVHGKGTGTLRQVVQDLLKASSYVDGWEIAGEKEGGAGVTIVKFKSD